MEMKWRVDYGDGGYKLFDTIEEALAWIWEQLNW
jgi:hypothetical protein